jgi:hypothetical protein
MHHTTQGRTGPEEARPRVALGLCLVEADPKATALARRTRRKTFGVSLGIEALLLGLHRTRRADPCAGGCERFTSLRASRSRGGPPEALPAHLAKRRTGGGGDNHHRAVPIATARNSAVQEKEPKISVLRPMGTRHDSSCDRPGRKIGSRFDARNFRIFALFCSPIRECLYGMTVIYQQGWHAVRPR